MLEQLVDRIESAMELARASGADDAWAWASRTRSVEYTYRDGKVETVKESTSRGLSLELYVDGRYSTHSTTDLDPQRLAAFIHEAVALTRALEPDPDRRIPDPALFRDRPTVDLDLLDDAVRSITPERRLEWVQDMNAAARSHERVISATSAVADEHTILAGASTNGFSGHKEGTAVQLYTEVTLRDDGDKRPEAWDWAAARHLEDLPQPRQVGEKALEKALQRLGATKGPSGRYTMVVDPQAGSRLVGALLAPATARSVHRGRSFWKGRLGEQLFSPLLDVRDEPLLPRGLRSRHFDGEGISARPLPIVRAGTAASLYVDTYYGRKVGMEPTTGSPSNRVMALGDGSLEDLLRGLDQAIYVTGWLGGNSDPTTGDFSFGIRGHLVESGSVGAPLGEMNVTGNLLELFRRLVAVGDDPWPYSSTLTPTLVFEGVEFSGS